MLAFVIGAALPIVCQLQHIEITGLYIVEMLTIFLVMSSFVGLAIAGILII
jgi:hypothetical protein